MGFFDKITNVDLESIYKLHHVFKDWRFQRWRKLNNVTPIRHKKQLKLCQKNYQWEICTARIWPLPAAFSTSPNVFPYRVFSPQKKTTDFWAFLLSQLCFKSASFCAMTTWLLFFQPSQKSKTLQVIITVYWIDHFSGTQNWDPKRVLSKNPRR